MNIKITYCFDGFLFSSRYTCCFDVNINIHIFKDARVRKKNLKTFFINSVHIGPSFCNMQIISTKSQVQSYPITSFTADTSDSRS